MTEREGRRRHTGIILAWTVILALTTVLVLGLVRSRERTSYTSRTVEMRLSDIGELVTQAGYFTNVQTISGSRELFGIEMPFTQSRYIYSYDGIIRAGMDFSDVKLDVSELTHKIYVTLPEVRIISVDLDESSLKVYDQQDSIFTPLKVETMNESMITMKDQARISAVENGIRKNAEENARQLLKGFLAATYDLSVYEVVFREASQQ